MPHKQWTIHAEPQAPAKPVWGAPCNGCGVCCLAEPCPLGMVLSRRRHGACSALRWQAATRTYQCGALVDTPQVLHDALPRFVRRLAPWLVGVLRRLAPRWIAAGQGCDCDLQADAMTIQRGQVADPAAAPADIHGRTP